MKSQTHLVDGACMVVPSGRREELMREAHNGQFSGHFAEKKIFERLWQRYTGGLE